MFSVPGRVLGAVVAWPARSQEGSRRNALVAGTALAARRHERTEVEEYLARVARDRTDGRAAEGTA